MADVVEVGRDGIHSSPEVHVVWEVEVVNVGKRPGDA